MAKLQEPKREPEPQLVACDWCDGTGAAMDGCPFTRQRRLCRKCHGTGRRLADEEIAKAKR